MPKARQRIVECDCLDCRDQSAVDTGLLLSAANEAVAKQDPPPKCLLLLVTGAAQPDPDSRGETSLDAAQSLPHLHRAAQEGGLGLLALRPNPAGRPEVDAAQLLGVQQDGDGATASTGTETQTLSQRFQGMRAAFDATTDSVRAVCQAAGMQPVALLQAGQGGQGPDAAAAARSVIRHLGIPQASSTEAASAGASSSSSSSDEVDADLDLLLLHLDAAAMPAPQAVASKATQQQAYEAAWASLEWLDQLLKHLAAEPSVRETVLLAVVLTPAGQPVAKGALRPSGSPLPLGKVLRPLQSFEQLEGQPVALDLDAPAVVLRRLAGVVRRDAAAGVGVKQALEQGVHGAILADRLLHELAYKVAKAPKYGA